MRTGAIAIKKGMTFMFDESGQVIPLTQLDIVECQVIQVKKYDEFGYNAVQVGAFDVKKVHRVNKPQRVFFEKIDLIPKRYLKEFRVSEDNFLNVGDAIDSSFFEVGKKISVQAKTIGKGFSGVMKKYGFSGLPASHGVSLKHRSGGSTGQCQDPGRVIKGTKMAGQHGNKMTTIHGLKIMDISDKSIFVKGAVPGSKNGVVFIRDYAK